MTIVPLKLYINERICKNSDGFSKGKKLYDKRETIKDRDNKRDLDRIRRNLIKVSFDFLAWVQTLNSPKDWQSKPFSLIRI